MTSPYSCSGCGLCLLACPVWRQTKDIRLTPQGRAKAIQHGATPADLAASTAACTLCGSCEPVCPEEIPLVDMVLELRQQHPLPSRQAPSPKQAPAGGGTVLLAGLALRTSGERLARVAALLDANIADDDGSDIALAVETGAALPQARIDRFLESVSRARRLVVAEGLLLRRLREWLPGRRMQSLGEALSALDAVRSKLRSSDLYVVEPRAYHHDHARLVGHYDRLRASTGMETNLDLQRLAVPATSADQARWILEGRSFERVVVEDADVCATFATVTDRPVVHLADL
jgi:NAD-dependent dihydropyrimidine dehydrogenase PreA subunit